MESTTIHTIDFDTFEIGNAILKRTKGITFRIMGKVTAEWVQVENPNRQEFFRIGILEYTFLSLLDGTRTLSDVYIQLCMRHPDLNIDESQIAVTARWAVDSGVAETARKSDSPPFNSRNETTINKISNFNPLSFRVPLCSPDSLVSKLTPYFSRIFSPLGAVLWILMVTLGTCFFLYNFDGIITNRVSAFSSADLLWMLIAWLFLKLLHEMGHAIACRNFGCEVGQSGLLFVLFLPIPFVDVTSIWREESKLNRMLVSACGIMIELWVASLCAIVWTFTDAGTFRFHLENLIIAAGVNTLLVNANPLMRFDGYYLLSDWIDIPNLYQKGREFVRGAAIYMVLGKGPTTSPEKNSRTTIIRIYGILSWLWSIALSLSLILAASAMGDGTGLILAGIGLLFWFIIPLCRGIYWVIHGHLLNRVSLIHLFATSTAIAVAGIALFKLIPAPSVVSAPFVLQINHPVSIFSEVDGFVEEILVNSGEHINEGQIIAKFSSEDLEFQSQAIYSKLEQCRLRIQRLLATEKIVELKMEEEILRDLYLRKASIDEKNSKLIIHSPVSGTVLTTDLTNLLGSYVRRGSKFCEIGDLSKLKAIALIKQDDQHWLKNKTGAPGKLSFPGPDGQGIACCLESIHPRSSDYLPHVAFAANFGGSMPTLNRYQLESETNNNPASKTNSTSSQAKDGAILSHETRSLRDLKLIEPCFQVEFAIPPMDLSNRGLYPGQTGIVTLAGRDQSLGNYWFSLALKSLSSQLRFNHGM